MGFSLIIDNTTLVLLLCIILTLLLSIYTSQSFQPLLHPLILTRQADVSRVRHNGESAIFRNANSPPGFDLAGRPRRGADNVGKMLKLGGATSAVTGTFGPGSGAQAQSAGAQSVRMRIYGSQTSTDDILATAQRFGKGLEKLCNAPALACAVCADEDSLSSCIALLTPAENAAFSLLVIPVAPVSQAPVILPASISSRTRTLPAAFATASSIERLLHWSLLDASAIIVLPDESQLKQAQHLAAGTCHRLMTLQQVCDSAPVGETGSTTAKEAAPDLHSVYAHWWSSRGMQSGWVPIANGALTAGVTAHLGAFSADKIPTRADSILVNCPSIVDQGGELLSPAHTPAGLVILLLALYTGANVQNVREGDWAKALAAAPETSMLYTAPLAAASLATSLTALSAKSPLGVGLYASRSKLYALRHGVNGTDTMWDRFHFNSLRRSSHIDKLRSITVVDEVGKQLSQNTVDILRAFTGGAIIHAYLPSDAYVADQAEKAPAYITAPIATSHAADLQAFDVGINMPYHVGPPSVSVEIKLVETPTSRGEKRYTIEAVKGRDVAFIKTRWPVDPAGEVRLRGKTVAVAPQSPEQTGVQAGDDLWVSTGDIGSFRTNGTLVIVESKTGADVIDVEPLGSAVSSPSSRKHPRHSAVGRATALSVIMLGVLGLATAGTTQAASSDATYHQLYPRASNSGEPNVTMISVARGGLLSAQRPSWVQGTAAAALLELDSSNWNYFAGEGNGPVYRAGNLDPSASGLPRDVANIAYHAIAAQDSRGRLCSRVTGEEDFEAGSSLDSSICAVPVLLAAVKNGQIVDHTPGKGYYVEGATKQLDFILTGTNRTVDGAISQRNSDIQIWSDSLYMVSSLAVYGLVYDNQTLLQTAYDQLRLYRQALLQPSGLLSHIWDASNSTWLDSSLWATGNGWAAAGFLRTLACIAQSSHSSAMLQQKADLFNWTSQLLDAAYPLQDHSTGLFHNSMNDTRTFRDAAGSMLLACGFRHWECLYCAEPSLTRDEFVLIMCDADSTFRFASMAADSATYIDAAEQVYQATSNQLDEFGHFAPSVQTVDALAFNVPGPTSPEALSFALMLGAARRDYHKKNVTGIYGPGSNNRLRPTLQNGRLTIGEIVNAAPPTASSPIAVACLIAILSIIAIQL
ncbi:hypothetical protein K437DRAFT_12587 [Tilletiaria anomala UBC 951]|uniref:Glycoside hydrolase family 105 protein n=1 Tax=Tilletiaria anomala (strain ATCC 24038 / CBS 436.72 / UBC 951) TaxID=1037660 RepID=A0A066VC53_TILAU|nr:uncharacterized protein K437DRAFT_12587 [Tilletiaria anomala UBC 951]KDN39322.1 hypothetical protein K437DRAFT_12587 [Tilletiaria anomala UBC 951]